jgi:hypothetical protein
MSETERLGHTQHTEQAQQRYTERKHTIIPDFHLSRWIIILTFARPLATVDVTVAKIQKIRLTA